VAIAKTQPLTAGLPARDRCTNFRRRPDFLKDGTGCVSGHCVRESGQWRWCDPRKVRILATIRFHSLNRTNFTDVGQREPPDFCGDRR
jgi:hypothetical protein